jgi:P pilus assembly chaperone PapD
MERNMKFLYKSFSFFCFTFLALFSLQLNASVIMTGTRIIYNEGSRSVDVNLKNQSDFPMLCRRGLMTGRCPVGRMPLSGFPLSPPPVFRIQPGAGQVVKVTFTGGLNLPDDRESVFYFNFLQVPPSNINKNDVKNKMLVMLRNRVKILSPCISGVWSRQGVPIYR